MESLELLTQAHAAGIYVKVEGETLSITGPSTAKALVNELIACKDDILSLLSQCPQVAPSALSDASPDHAPATGDGRTHAPYIAKCPCCGGTCWGPTAPPMPETLRTGEQVTKETWVCLDCITHPEGTPAHSVPETIPPGLVSSPCPECDKPYRLHVPSSPDIVGEPDQAVLICGRCGFIETPEASLKRDTQNATACWECGPYTVVRDARGLICYKCHTRL